MRTATVKRETAETHIKIELDIDGSGSSTVTSDIPFFNHMLETFAHHGLFDITACMKGDISVDQHHIMEDTGITLGKAFKKALNDKKGVKRAGFFVYPMDETLVLTSIDLSGRPYLVFNAQFSHDTVGDFYVGLVEDFFQAVVSSLGAALHIQVLYGRSDHHKLEAIFKAWGKSLKTACEIEPRQKNIPSVKGIL